MHKYTYNSYIMKNIYFLRDSNPIHISFNIIFVGNTKYDLYAIHVLLTSIVTIAAQDLFDNMNIYALINSGRDLCHLIKKHANKMISNLDFSIIHLDFSSVKPCQAMLDDLHASEKRVMAQWLKN